MPADAIDWSQWHSAYDDPGSSLSARRRAVQVGVRRWLDQAPLGRCGW